MQNNFLFLCLSKVLTNEYEDKYAPSKPTASNPVETDTFTEISPTKRARGKQDKVDKKKKKNDKVGKKPERKKQGKDSKVAGKKNTKKVLTFPEKEAYPKTTKKPTTAPPKSSLATFLDYFENRRRLLVRDSNHRHAAESWFEQMAVDTSYSAFMLLHTSSVCVCVCVGFVLTGST